MQPSYKNQLKPNEFILIIKPIASSVTKSDSIITVSLEWSLFTFDKWRALRDTNYLQRDTRSSRFSQSIYRCIVSWLCRNIRCIQSRLKVQTMSISLSLFEVSEHVSTYRDFVKCRTLRTLMAFIFVYDSSFRGENYIEV